MIQNKFLPLLLALFFLTENAAFAQNNPTFDSFEGTVYKLPARKIGLGYGKPVLDYEVIAQVSYKELMFPEQLTIERMPGIDIANGFGIIFKNTMHIPVDGEYAFSLNSDDGSILWIEEKTIINNDKPHKMRLRADTVQLRKGDYPIKIWYFQGYPDVYGLEFKSKFLRHVDMPTEEAKLEFHVSERELRFETGSAEINQNGRYNLTILAEQLSKTTYQKMEIIGHTDNIGNEESNLTLSRNRAAAVAKFLTQRLEQKGVQIEFTIIGKGESEPAVSNETEDGRASNRRVVLRPL